MAEYRRSAEMVRYESGGRELPGYLYRPRGSGPFPAVLWNHGSEKEPRAQPELARFYTEHGFVFFVADPAWSRECRWALYSTCKREIAAKESDRSVVQRKQVKLHDVYNADVVAALAWLKERPFVDRERIIVSGVSYGGIQTLITAEKGLGVRGFISFAPGAMSFAKCAP